MAVDACIIHPIALQDPSGFVAEADFAEIRCPSEYQDPYSGKRILIRYTHP